MKQRNLIGTCVLACVLAFGMSGANAGSPSDPLAQAQDLVTTAPGVSVSVYVTGLNNPRGLKFHNGRLIVAEGGTGGTQSTAGQCDQIDPPIGPYTGSANGSRISRILEFGDPGFRRRVTIQANLPSSQTSPNSGSLVSGVADIAYIGDTLYALIGGAGCSHGVATRDNAIVRIVPGGSPVLVANLSRWLKAHPGTALGPDVETDGTWYSMVAFDGGLYVVEPNNGLFVRVNPATGAISRILDVSAALGGHSVPTALARHNGYFYISNLGTFPIVDGTQRVWRVLSDPPRLQVVARGTAILGIAFDGHGGLYLLQMTSGSPEPTPGMGSIVRIRSGGGPQTIVSGLTLPTAMVMSPDGHLYVSHIGFGPPLPGSGQILKVTLPH